MTKKKFKANLPHTQTPFYAARTIGDKTLVLIDVGDEEKKYIRMKEDLMNFCDIVCIVYAEDNDDSFTYISDLVDNFFEFSIDVPIYLISTCVATKLLSCNLLTTRCSTEKPTIATKQLDTSSTLINW